MAYFFYFAQGDAWGFYSMISWWNFAMLALLQFCLSTASRKATTDIKQNNYQPIILWSKWLRATRGRLGGLEAGWNHTAAADMGIWITPLTRRAFTEASGVIAGVELLLLAAILPQLLCGGGWCPTNMRSWDLGQDHINMFFLESVGIIEESGAQICRVNHFCSICEIVLQAIASLVRCIPPALDYQELL